MGKMRHDSFMRFGRFRFAHLAFAAAEIFALAATLILRFFLLILGAAVDPDWSPSIRPSSVSSFSIFSRIAMA